ncbi:MAG: SDR family NAD(P)-dependent oxidoreductase [Deltaproteobacteria bacterium]|jgi:short-subunit dehydrogenase|nr:SDR family NAD(P)-dependent oxidoreductase [Deltaproteobacteria bacterium]
MKDPVHIAITGASGGLGRALVKCYAAPGVHFFLCGRNSQELEKTAHIAKEKGAELNLELFDVTDPQALENWLTASDGAKPLDLVVANAGICRGIGDDGLESPKDMLQTFEVNTKAMLHTAIVAASLMLPRKKGQVALISSQAARLSLVNAPSYSASKAAVRNYGHSLRCSMADKGLEVTVVCPGYLKTPMLETFTGPLPGTWDVDKAANYIVKKLRLGPREIKFPWILNRMIDFLDFLPQSWAEGMSRRFSFKVKPANEKKK